jgi:hypothetical protein
MRSRDWDRIVGLCDDGRLVAVYSPATAAADSSLRVTVAVLNRDQLVVASGRSNLEPLLQLAMSRPEWKDRSKWKLSRL